MTDLLGGGHLWRGPVSPEVDGGEVLSSTTSQDRTVNTTGSLTVAGAINCVVEAMYTYTMVMMTSLALYWQASLRSVELLVWRCLR